MPQTHRRATKMDAITEHLDCAVDLFFKERHLSSHVLASAAFEMLSEVIDQSTTSSMSIKKEIHTKLGKERGNKVIGGMLDDYNFLKHSRNSKETEIQLSLDKTESIIVLSCQHYHEVNNFMTARMHAMLMWAKVKYPKLQSDHFKDKVMPQLSSDILSLDKDAFLQFIEHIKDQA